MNDPVFGLARLRQATQDIHDAFEEELKVAKPAAGKSDYRIFIQAMWGWLSPFEHQLWQAEWPAAIHPERRADKCAWLLSDLRNAGLEEEEISALPLAPCSLDLDSLASRFGVAYVLEGAQLGSAVLAKRIGTALEPWPVRWLKGYGADASINWREFVQSAESHLAGERESAIAAASARQTFASLQSWFQLRGAA